MSELLPPEPPDELQFRMTRDLVKAAKTLSKEEVGYLVDSYYIMQDQRIRSAHQVRQLTKAEKPCAVLEWLFSRSEILENQVKRALGSYAESNVDGQWALSVIGIGPVITAGLLSHIDITKAPTVGHIWSFAGLVNKKWEKGEKRPWNASLKRLCWLIGQSFMKQAGRDNCYYGKVYLKRKEQEIINNEEGKFAEQAEKILSEKGIGKEKMAYKFYAGCLTAEQGKQIRLEESLKREALAKKLAGEPGSGLRMLPPAQIEQRAERYATKLFLAHLHEVMYVNHFGMKPPKPYPIAILGHTHQLEVPMD